jgi:hypothetical protein
MHDVSVTELSSEAKATTAADASVQRMVCTGCGAEANASCNCGVAYMPKSVRAAEAVKANPEKSSRAIANEIGVDKNTVEKARKELTGDKSPVDKRRGLDGKTRKPPKKSATVKLNGRHAVKTDDLGPAAQEQALTNDKPMDAPEDVAPVEAAAEPSNKENVDAFLSFKNSAYHQRQFEEACNTYLPHLNDADLDKTHDFFVQMYERLKEKKKAA